MHGSWCEVLQGLLLALLDLLCGLGLTMCCVVFQQNMVLSVRVYVQCEVLYLTASCSAQREDLAVKVQGMIDVVCF